MNKGKRGNKAVRGTAVALCVAALGMGAVSYFTQYNSATTSKATAGDFGLTFNLETTELTDDTGLLTPGDVKLFNYSGKNTGNIPVDVKQVITITSDKAMNPADMEFKLVDANNGSETLIETNGDVVLSNDNKTATYTLKDKTVEVETMNAKAGSPESNYGRACYFMFDKDAKNNMEGAKVDVKVEVFAKQHKNTQEQYAPDTDWTQIVDKTVSVAE